MASTILAGRWYAVVCTALLPLCAAGCGTSGGGTLPSNDIARTALESALKLWRDGGKPGIVAGTDPAVMVFDTPWAHGDRLKDYEILKDEANVADRQFNVHLTLEKPAQEQDVVYHVIGQGPVQVFRDEDFLRNINMENAAKQQKTTKARQGRK